MRGCGACAAGRPSIAPPPDGRPARDAGAEPGNARPPARCAGSRGPTAPPSPRRAGSSPPSSPTATTTASGSRRRRVRPGSVRWMAIELVEFTDPACSYAWGTEPKVRRLRWQYGHRLRWRRVMVGLHAPGWEIDRNDQGRADPELPWRVSDYWAGVGALSGMTFPSPLHYAHVCTD